MEEDNTLPTTVKFVRMVTGEDLIVEITEVQQDDAEQESYYVFHKPLKIIYAAGRNSGVLSMHFMQWVFTNVCPDQTFIVYPHEVLTIGNPADHLITYYNNTLTYFDKKDRELAALEEGDGIVADQEVPLDIKEHINNFFDSARSSNKKRLH